MFISWTVFLLVMYAVGMIIQQSYVMHLTRILQVAREEEHALDQQFSILLQEIAQLEKKEVLCAALAPEEFVPLAQYHLVQLT